MGKGLLLALVLSMCSVWFESFSRWGLSKLIENPCARNYMFMMSVIIIKYIHPSNTLYTHSFQYPGNATFLFDLFLTIPTLFIVLLWEYTLVTPALAQAQLYPLDVDNGTHIVCRFHYRCLPIVSVSPLSVSSIASVSPGIISSVKDQQN